MEDSDQRNFADTEAEPQFQRFSLLSHDILSTLSEVVGGVRLLDPEMVTDAGRPQLNRIIASGEALARLLEGILAVDEHIASGTEMTARNVNLARFLESTENRWIGMAQEKGIEFSVEKSESLPAVITVDRIAIDRIIANLVSNAIKYTDQGSVILKVFCSDNNDLCFDVCDQGPGFSDEAFAHLFEYKVRPADNAKPGIGLGLFIAKDLSALIGGHLTASNALEGGATMSFHLPHTAWFNRSLIRSLSETDDTEDEIPDLSHLKILLAEDNATNQLVATQMLRAMNATCSVASDGVEAFELLKKETFDVVLLDIEMPRMSGIELIKNIRAVGGQQSQMTLVALTAYVMRDHRERIYEAGADGIIAKPLMRVEDLGRGILEFHNRKIPELALSTELHIVDDIDSLLKPNEVIDRQIFDNLVEIIGPESSHELMGKLQADTDSVAEGISLGRRNLDLSELRAQTHILISVAGAIGATNLQILAQRLNGAANRQDAAEIDQLCKACLTGLADLQAFIRGEQEKATPPLAQVK